MGRYYVNKNVQANGDHEVHKDGCTYMPLPENGIYLGYFNSCAEAIRAAKAYYTQVNGCYYCSIACHTQ